MPATRTRFQPKHDGWDDLRRMWQRVPACEAPAPEPLPVVESPPLAPLHAAPAALRRFNPRAALLRMVSFGQPDPLFVALYRAHPAGPPPDVVPAPEGGRLVIRPEPLFSRWEA